MTPVSASAKICDHPSSVDKAWSVTLEGCSPDPVLSSNHEAQKFGFLCFVPKISVPQRRLRSWRRLQGGWSERHGFAFPQVRSRILRSSELLVLWLLTSKETGASGTQGWRLGMGEESRLVCRDIRDYSNDTVKPDRRYRKI